jgi:O-antigen/teichoic acid export membrane protein
MSKFLSNVIKLGSATIAGQIIGIIVAPVLSRLYLPADFGVFQLFLSFVSLIAIISCFSYNSAINLPKKHEDAASIVVLCMFLIVVTTIISAIFFFVFADDIAEILNAPGFATYIFLLPLAIISNSIAFVLGSWSSRREQFGTLAKGNLYSSISGKGVSVGYGFISPSPFGLILGTITNDVTILVVLLKRTFTDAQLFRQVTYKNIKEMALRYKKFPQYNLFSNLANTAGVQSTPLMLAFFFSPIIVGYYAVALLTINLPLKLVGNSITSVFYQKACVEKNLTGSVKNIVKTVNSRLISIGMFGCLLVVIIGPELFSFVLGSTWLTAGEYAQILTPWFFVVFISVPLWSIYSVLEKQHISLSFNVILLVSRIIVLVIGGTLGNPILTMFLLSTTGVIIWSGINMYTLKISGVSVSDSIREIIYYLVLSLLVSLPLIIAKSFSVSSNILIGIAIILAIIYYSFIIHRDTQLKEGLLQFVGKIRVRITGKR